MRSAPMECQLQNVAADLDQPFAIVSQRRGLLSRHRTISTATLAYCVQLQCLASWDDPPQIYEYSATGWRRV